MDLGRDFANVLLAVPGFEDTASRIAFVHGAGLDRELVQHIDFNGSAYDFVAELSTKSVDYDRLSAGPSTVERLLDEVVRQTGADKRGLVDAFRRKYLAKQDTPLARFLRSLGLDPEASANSYATLPTTFVAPARYPAIKEILEKWHVVLILGDPHIGKTYTAIHLLWELFLEGWTSPRWLSSNDLAILLDQGPGQFRQRVHSLLQSGATLYVEDPFGTTVQTDIPEFVANFRTFLVMAEEANARVVITSRSYVFNRVISEQFNPYVVTLKQELLVDSAYDDSALARILDRYVHAYAARWARALDERITEQVTRELSAPHNIELFVRRTRNIDNIVTVLRAVADHNDLSGEFAWSIANLPTWQQAFLLVAQFFVTPEYAGDARALFEAGMENNDFGGVDVAAWEIAGASVGEYVTWHNIGEEPFCLPRHPSVEEGLDRCVRADPVLVEVVRRLVQRATSADFPAFRLSAFRAFVHHAGLFWGSRWGTDIFRSYMDSNSVMIRESSRKTLISELNSIPPSSQDLILDYVEHSWNERFLVRMLLTHNLPQARRQRLLARLAATWDDWVRYRLAYSLDFVAEAEDAEPVLMLLDDRNRSVRVAAARSAIRSARTSPGWRAEVVSKAVGVLRSAGMDDELASSLDEQGACYPEVRDSD